MKAAAALAVFLIPSWAFAQDCCKDGEAKPWEGYNKAVRWEDSLAEAQTRAKAENKLIFYYVLVGDLRKEGC